MESVRSLIGKQTNLISREGPLVAVVSTGRRNTLSLNNEMECDDGSRLSSRVYGGREDGVMGSLAARGVAQSDRTDVWQAFIVYLFPAVSIRWNSSSSSESLAIGVDALWNARRYREALRSVDRRARWPGCWAARPRR